MLLKMDHPSTRNLKLIQALVLLEPHKLDKMEHTLDNLSFSEKTKTDFYDCL